MCFLCDNSMLKNIFETYLHPIRGRPFNPILGGGGPLWPGRPWTASLFPQGKSYDHQNSWLCFCLCLNGPMKVIFGVCFQNFWKTEKFFFDDFDIKGSPLWKKNQKYSKKWFFFKETYFFILNLNSTGS